jgi:hypothetical protein
MHAWFQGACWHRAATHNRQRVLTLTHAAWHGSLFTQPPQKRRRASRRLPPPVRPRLCHPTARFPLLRPARALPCRVGLSFGVGPVHTHGGTRTVANVVLRPRPLAQRTHVSSGRAALPSWWCVCAVRLCHTHVLLFCHKSTGAWQCPSTWCACCTDAVVMTFLGTVKTVIPDNGLLCRLCRVIMRRGRTSPFGK